MTAEELLQRYAAGERDFSGVNLSGADFSGRILTGIRLNNANLTGINLAGTGLDSARLCHANLSGANLEGVGRVGICPSYRVVRYDKGAFRGSVTIGSQPMKAILLSSEEVAKRAYQIYESKIRQEVETEENIGKMVIINIETGDYEVDETGLQAAQNLQTKFPYARLFGIRIGYNVAASFGGVMERVSSDFRYGN